MGYKKYTTSPYVRIYLDSQTPYSWILQNLDTGHKYSVSWELISLLDFCSKPKNINQIYKFLRKITIFDIEKTVDKIIKDKLIISTHEFRSDKNMKLWNKYNWTLALHFLLDSSLAIFADKESSGPQSAITNSYIKNSPLPHLYKKLNTLKISLPLKKSHILPSLGQTLLKRKTSRSFSKPLSLDELSEILYLSSEELKRTRQINEEEIKTDSKTLTKSLFIPFEIYVVLNNVLDVKNGIYHYDILNHALRLIKLGTFNKKVSYFAHGETFLDNASAIILISSIFERLMFRYRHSGAYKDLLINTSQLAHFMILFATALDVKTFETPALLDSPLAQLLKIDSSSEDILYLVGLGK